MTGREPDNSEEFLKTDALERVRVRTEQREKLPDAFEASAMSGQAFALHHGIKVQTFASWVSGGNAAPSEVSRQLPRQP